MTDGDALLAAVIANPDEDTPRLAYADWLREQGGEARAEYIREAILGGGPPLAAGGSVGSLRQAFAGFGIPPDWPGGWRAGIRRGFVEALSCPAEDWLRFGDGVRRLHPVTRVTLTTWYLGFDITQNSSTGERRIVPYGEPVDSLPVDSLPVDSPAGTPGYAGLSARALASLWPGVEFVMPTRFAAGVGGTVQTGSGPPVPISSWSAAFRRGGDLPVVMMPGGFSTITPPD